jgi:hypothetical protein
VPLSLLLVILLLMARSPEAAGPASQQALVNPCLELV